MAYIHVKIDKNSPAKLTLLRLDGWQNMMINGEKYIEVAPGTHVIELYGPNTNYVFRGKLNENGVWEVVAMLGLETLMHYGSSFFTVVFEPEQYIKPLNADEIKKIEEIVAAEQKQAQMQQDKQERKDARIMAVVQIVWALIALVIAVAACAVAVEEPVGILFAIGFFLLAGFLLTKAIKNFKK